MSAFLANLLIRKHTTKCLLEHFLKSQFLDYIESKRLESMTEGLGIKSPQYRSQTILWTDS